MGNVLHVIFRYFIDTQAGVVLVEHLLLHKGDANNVLPTAIAYCCIRDTGIVYRVPWGVYRDKPVYRSCPTQNDCRNPRQLQSNSVL